MNTKEWADKLNNIEYPCIITKEEHIQAQTDGVVIVFGGSDDLMEFRGAIYDEVGVCGGGTAYLSATGLLENKCHDSDCPYFEAQKSNATTIEALWCEEDPYSFTYKTSIPHETFDVMEDGEKYCRGIVFYLKDVK